VIAHGQCVRIDEKWLNKAADRLASEAPAMADNLGYSIFLDRRTPCAPGKRGALQPTVRWSEMMHEQHAVAFTVAKVAKLDLLRQIQTSLDSVIREGGTLEEWKKGLIPQLQRAGWWGAVNDKALTGTDSTVIVNERRLRTIYDTNVRMSLASGNWARIQSQKDVLPYLRSAQHQRTPPPAAYCLVRHAAARRSSVVADPFSAQRLGLQVPLRAGLPAAWRARAGRSRRWAISPPGRIPPSSRQRASR
jgi:hypothetical protein